MRRSRARPRSPSRCGGQDLARGRGICSRILAVDGRSGRKVTCILRAHHDGDHETVEGEDPPRCVCDAEDRSPHERCPGNVCDGPKCGGYGRWHREEEHCLMCGGR